LVSQIRSRAAEIHCEVLSNVSPIGESRTLTDKSSSEVIAPLRRHFWSNFLVDLSRPFEAYTTQLTLLLTQNRYTHRNNVQTVSSKGWVPFPDPVCVLITPGEARMNGNVSTIFDQSHTQRELMIQRDQNQCVSLDNQKQRVRLTNKSPWSVPASVSFVCTITIGFRRLELLNHLTVSAWRLTARGWFLTPYARSTVPIWVLIIQSLLHNCANDCVLERDHGILNEKTNTGKIVLGMEKRSVLPIFQDEDNVHSRRMMNWSMQVSFILFDKYSRFHLRHSLSSVSQFLRVLKCDITVQMIRQSVFFECQNSFNTSQGWTPEQLSRRGKQCKDVELIVNLIIP
jgi:hypothetical protein